jgi:hypothetical protein
MPIHLIRLPMLVGLVLALVAGCSKPEKELAEAAEEPPVILDEIDSEDASKATPKLDLADSVPTRWITAEPRLLPVKRKCGSTAPGWVLAGPLTVSAYIYYNEHGRNDKTVTVTRTFQATGSMFVYEIDFGPEILQGGKIHVSGTCVQRHTSGKTVTTAINSKEGLVTAANPGKANVKARLGSLSLQVIAYKESRFQQFDAQGLPKFGPPHGFGIMQLDNPPATPRQIWDWQGNIDGGKALYTKKAQEVEQHFKNIYQAHPTAPHLTPDQLKFATYQYYNSGSFYWSWNQGTTKWEKSGSTAYGDDAVRIENLVTGGQPPPEWN